MADVVFAGYLPRTRFEPQITKMFSTKLLDAAKTFPLYIYHKLEQKYF